MRRAGGLVFGWRLATRVAVAAAGTAMLVSGSGATAAAPTPHPDPDRLQGDVQDDLRELHLDNPSRAVSRVTSAAWCSPGPLWPGFTSKDIYDGVQVNWHYTTLDGTCNFVIQPTPGKAGIDYKNIQVTEKPGYEATPPDAVDLTYNPRTAQYLLTAAVPFDALATLSPQTTCNGFRLLAPPSGAVSAESRALGAADPSRP